jgi:hypothetical protein
MMSLVYYYLSFSVFFVYFFVYLHWILRSEFSLDTAISSLNALAKIKAYFIMNVIADSSLKFKDIIRYISKDILSRIQVQIQVSLRIL